MSFPRDYWLQVSIDTLPGPRTIRLVLEPAVARTCGMMFAKILHPDKTRAFVWERYHESGLHAWVERSISLSDLASKSLAVFDVRREKQAQARIVSLEEEREDESDDKLSLLRRQRYALTEPMYTVHEPEREDPSCIFDTGLLLDLPPDGWPLTGTLVERHRNILPDVKPTPARVWAGHVWAGLKSEWAEERHANRVLENERLAEYQAYKKQEQEAQLLIEHLRR